MSSFAHPHAYATLSYPEAVATIEGYSALLTCSHPPETVTLLEALGRVVAEPILADRDQPPFPRSTRDGFACRAAEVATGAPLRVAGLLRAGESWPGSALGAREAVEIMTGAPLPLGTDCVVMIEHVERTADVIRLVPGRQIAPGENFISTGAEARAGATLVASGTRLGPSQIAAAATVGASRLRVYPRPKVAIVSTGDELVSLDSQPLAFQIRNSNSYSIAAQVLALGAEPLLQPIAADSERALDQSVRAAVTDGCDLLLLSGGVSMGKYDLVEGVLASLGAGFFFTGVRIQPGKPVVFGELASLGRLPFFGLPGNPVSTMVTFALFVAPLLAALGGEHNYTPRFAQARLAESVQLKPRLQRFLPSRLTANTEAATVALVPWQGSGDIAGTAQANCLLIVPEPAPGSSDHLTSGELVNVLLL